MSHENQSAGETEKVFKALSAVFADLHAHFRQELGHANPPAEPSPADEPQGWFVPMEHNGVRGVLAFLPLNAELRLSPRQLEIAALVLAGRKSWEIALKLGTRENTVLSQLKQIYLQNGIDSRADLVRELFCSSIRKMVADRLGPAGRESTEADRGRRCGVR